MKTLLAARCLVSCSLSATLLLTPISPVTSHAIAEEAPVWIEAECFDTAGGWSRDTQHVDTMGSPYLLATGVGRPVKDAVTRVEVPQTGTYRLWVRCRDWLSPHSPGRFRLVIDGRESKIFGAADGEDDRWQWFEGGNYELSQGEIEFRLRDLTGWWSRVDVIVLAPAGFTPAEEMKSLAQQRLTYADVSPAMVDEGRFDVVVIGAGPAGMGAAVAAARNGARVALIQDRPVVGGNSSSEISVPPMGYIGSPPDRVNVTGLCEEFFPVQGWNNLADSAHMESIIAAEPNIALFLNTRAIGVTMKGSTPKASPLRSGEKGAPGTIDCVVAIDVRTGQRRVFSASLFIDCTGHGWIGYYAGAEYRMGQEARDEYAETLAPIKPGVRTQGNTLYQAFIVTRDQPVTFECPEWAYQWRKDSDFEPRGGHRRIKEIRRPENYDVPAHGKGRNPGDDIDGTVVRRWWVEYGGMLNMIEDAEKIRDELFRINLGLWNYAKNHNPKTKAANAHRELVWLNYVPGVRESRRLIGPHVMSQAAYDQRIIHEDTVAFTDWGPDVHHPEGFWVKGNDCIHVYGGRRTSIPYRSLYSKNISNLLMAGRCHSATHIAMGGTRVMRPCMAMGQAAGTAAAIAAANRTTPDGVYKDHLVALQQALLKDGCYLLGVRNEDPRDLARSARIAATSSAEGLPSTEVADGYSRVVGKDRNAWLAEGAGPHQIEFDLGKKQKVNVAHITFEGRTVTARIEALVHGRWTEVALAGRPARRGYPSRRHVVPLTSVETAAVRFTLSQPVAVCEIRLYNEPDAVRQAIVDRSRPLVVKVAKPELPGIFLDDTEAEPVGFWSGSTFKRPFFCRGYSTDDNQEKGRRSLTFKPQATGRYEVRFAYVSLGNRATNVPITVSHIAGEAKIKVDQRKEPPIDGRFISLGVFQFDEDSTIRVDTDGTDGYVIVDGLQLLPAE